MPNTHTHANHSRQWKRGDDNRHLAEMEQQQSPLNLQSSPAPARWQIRKVCKSDDFSTGKTAEKAALNCCLLAGGGKKRKEEMIGSGAGGVAFKSTNYLCNGSGTTNEFADGQTGHNALKYAVCATVCVCLLCVCVCVGACELCASGCACVGACILVTAQQSLIDWRKTQQKERPVSFNG